MELIFSQEHRYAYTDEQKIETGNTIYRAIDRTFERTVCLKVVHIDGKTEQERRKLLSIAKNEISIMTRLESETNYIPRIYTIHYDEDTHNLYIVMQWIYGNTLERFMGKTPPQKILLWMAQLCHILAAMQSIKITHKDIKPANIMIAKDDRVYLIDFNLSISPPHRMEGTEGYRAPEMMENSKTPDREKVDIFAIGVILYQHFVGKRPQRGDEYALSKRNYKEWEYFIPPIEKNPNIDKKINDIIVKCMACDPAQRYANASALCNALDDVRKSLGGKGGRRR